jgi:hypothetical protein
MTGSGQGLVAGCCECSGEPSGSCAMELVKSGTCLRRWREQWETRSGLSVPQTRLKTKSMLNMKQEC